MIRGRIFNNLKELAVQSQIERPDSALAFVGPSRFAIRLDADPVDFITTTIDDINVAMAEYISPAQLTIETESVAEAVNTFNKREISRMTKSVIGVDVVAAEPWLGTQLTAFRRENINLIKSLVGNELNDIENILLRGQKRGLRVEVLREQIQKRFGVSRSKADLLARDQTNKLNAQLTELRQTSLGIEKYRWRTSLDEDVRKMHADLEGTVHSWNDPPVTNSAGDRNHPGEDYQCRCWAEPIVEPLLEAAGR